MVAAFLALLASLSVAAFLTVSRRDDARPAQLAASVGCLSALGMMLAAPASARTTALLVVVLLVLSVAVAEKRVRVEEAALRTAQQDRSAVLLWANGCGLVWLIYELWRA